jgi:hypothetical protein
MIRALRAEGITTWSGLARALNARGVPTPTGKARWTDVTVRQHAVPSWHAARMARWRAARWSDPR